MVNFPFSGIKHEVVYEMESRQENRHTISMIAGFVKRLPKSSPPKLGRPGARKEKLTKNCKEKDNKFYY